MKISRTDRFNKAWERLDESQKVLARKAIRHLVEDLKYPSLSVKKMKGTNYLWEVRASRSLRITFQIAQGIIVLRNIGRHDETLIQP